MQSKQNSFIEALINTGIGLGITILFSPIVYRICDVEISNKQMGGAAALFTIISIVRGYVVRRFFNKLTEKP